MRTYSLTVTLKSAARLLWSVLLWCNIPLSVQVREVYFTDNLTDNYLIAMTLYDSTSVVLLLMETVLSLVAMFLRGNIYLGTWQFIVIFQ